MRKRALSLAAAAALGLTFAGIPDSHATFMYLSCGSEPIRWPEPFGMTQNVCSVPTGGDVHDAYLNAMARWNGVTGMDNMVYHLAAAPPWDCSTAFGDYVNEFAVVAASTIDGRLGRTFMDWD